jgi:hypothetical protein
MAGSASSEYRPVPCHSNTHDYVRELESGIANGQAVVRVCQWLDRDGYVPDIVIGHNGWGGFSLSGRMAAGPLLGYFEFFYRGADRTSTLTSSFLRNRRAMRLRTRNAVNLLGLEAADWGQTPTHWQRSYPQATANGSRSCMRVDTDLVRPDETASVAGQWASPFRAEIVTYSAAISSLIAGSTYSCERCRSAPARPQAKILIAGMWRQLWTPAAARRHYREQLLAELEAQSSAARALSRPSALPPISDGAADLERTRLLIPVRTFLVAAGRCRRVVSCRLSNTAGRR